MVDILYFLMESILDQWSFWLLGTVFFFLLPRLIFVAACSSWEGHVEARGWLTLFRVTPPHAYIFFFTNLGLLEDGESFVHFCVAPAQSYFLHLLWLFMIWLRVSIFLFLFLAAGGCSVSSGSLHSLIYFILTWHRIFLKFTDFLKFSSLLHLSFYSSWASKHSQSFFLNKNCKSSYYFPSFWTFGNIFEETL